MINIEEVSLEEFLGIAKIKVSDHYKKIAFMASPETRKDTLEGFLALLPRETTLVFDSMRHINNDISKWQFFNSIENYMLLGDKNLLYVYSFEYGNHSVETYLFPYIRPQLYNDLGFPPEFVIYDVIKYTNKKGKRGENNMKTNLNTMMKKFMPEKLHDEVAFGMAGNLAVRAADGNYYYYDGHQLINVYDMVIPMEGMAMLIPAQTLAEGDIVKYNDSFYHITKYSIEEITGINLSSGTVDDIKLTTDLLGVSAFRKVVSIMDMIGGTDTMLGSNANPFSYFMIMSLFNDNETSDSDNPMMKMIQLQMMSHMFGATNPVSNPFFSMFGQPVKTEDATQEA